MHSFMWAPRTILVSLVLLVVSASVSNAGCRLRVNPSTVPFHNGVADYDPTSAFDYVAEFDVTVRQTGKNRCRGFVFFQNDSGNGVLEHEDGTSSIPYTLTEQGALADLIYAPSEDPEDAIRVNTNNRVVLTFNLTIAAGQPAEAGIYEEDITVVIERANGVVLDEFDITICLDVPTVAELDMRQISPVATGYSSSASVDFGFLTEDEQSLLELRVRTNTNYRISVTSENGGELFRDGTDGTSSSWFMNAVPYTFLLDSEILSLGPGTPSQTPEFFFDPAVAPLNGEDFHDVSITIGSIDQRRSGPYSDFITVTIVPNG